MTILPPSNWLVHPREASSLPVKPARNVYIHIDREQLTRDEQTEHKAPFFLASRASGVRQPRIDEMKSGNLTHELVGGSHG